MIAEEDLDRSHLYKFPIFACTYLDFWGFAVASSNLFRDGPLEFMTQEYERLLHGADLL